MGARSVVVVGYPDAELLDIACVTSALGMANALGALSNPYRVAVVSVDGQPIRCRSGLWPDGSSPGPTLHSDSALQQTSGPIDTLIISGGVGCERAAADPVLIAGVQRLAGQARRLASVCSGAAVLAAAGLLEGRRVATHWSYAGRLSARHPGLRVDPDPIFIRDAHVSTTAGVTSALDLTLALIEEDHGPHLARQVARALVTYLQRPGTQAQVSMFNSVPPAEHELVRAVERHVGSHLDGDLRLAALADCVGVSPRHLSRIFVAETGMTPAQFVRRARTEAAANLLATTTLVLTTIAARCGFGTVESLRQAFRARYGVSPSQHRAAHTRTSKPSPRATPTP